MFISAAGRRKLLLLGSGLKASPRCFLDGPWSISIRVTWQDDRWQNSWMYSAVTINQSDTKKGNDMYFLFEGPGQQGVVLAPHYHKEQRKVCPFAHAVSIQVDSGTHLISKVSCIKWLWIQRQCLCCHSFLFPSLVVAYLPDQSPVVARRLQHLETQVHVSQSDLVDTKHVVVSIKLSLQGCCREVDIDYWVIDQQCVSPVPFTRSDPECV